MKRLLIALVILIVVAAGGFFAFALRHSEIAAIEPPQAASFAAEQVEKGELLASIGDCAVCHTAPGGQPLAGGLALPTPFGTIHSTNITPDPDTGIGRWSVDAFKRALHQGIDREGGYLYPAFPYDHFTKVTDADLDAVYAYLMSQPPVKVEPKPNGLAFPFNQRILLAGWNFLFLDDKRFAPDAAKSEAWNRGAYLAEGLGHCGACHTPRNALGAVDSGQHLSGGEAEGWHAPALNAASPAPLPWTQDALVNYFLDGWDGDHGVAAGPMTPVVNHLANIPEEDAYALAEYLTSFQNQADAEKRTADAKAFADERDFGGATTPAAGPPSQQDAALQGGQATFVKICANCHRSGTETASMTFYSSVNGPDPRNVIHVIQDGMKPPENSADHGMPPLGGGLSDEDMTNLVTFVRAHFSKQPAWPDVAAKVKEVRGAKE